MKEPEDDDQQQHRKQHAEHREEPVALRHLVGVPLLGVRGIDGLDDCFAALLDVVELHVVAVLFVGLREHEVDTLFVVDDDRLLHLAIFEQLHADIGRDRLERRRCDEHQRRPVMTTASTTQGMGPRRIFFKLMNTFAR